MLGIRRLQPVQVKLLGWDKVWLNVWDYGGDGPTLLFCHCTGGLGRLWEPVIRRLQGRYHCYAPDARGHGLSAKPVDWEAYDWHYYTRDILALLDAMHLEGGILAVGHSAGATHLVDAALQRPERFRGLLLLDPVMAPANMQTQVELMCQALAERTRRRVTEFPTPAAAQARFSEKPPLSRWTEETLRLYVDQGLESGPDGVFTLRCPNEIEAWTYEWAAKQRIFDRIHELEVPVTLVTGDESDIAPFVALQAQSFGNLQACHSLPASHFIPQEVPTAVAELVDAWASQAVGSS